MAAPTLDLITFTNLIVTTLNHLHPLLCTPSSINLLLGTAAHESLFGQQRHQKRGPAHGIMGIEEATLDDIVRRRVVRYPILGHITFDSLIDDDEFSVIVARMKYLDA